MTLFLPVVSKEWGGNVVQLPNYSTDRRGVRIKTEAASQSIDRLQTREDLTL